MINHKTFTWLTCLKVLHFKNYGKGKEDAKGKVKVKRSTHHGAKDSSEICLNFCAGEAK